jgi:hypothetical protein
VAPKYKQVDSAFFAPIFKVEKERAVQREFASLNARLEMEQVVLKEEVVKRPVKSLKKDKRAVLHRPSLEPIKKSRCKVKKNYLK